MLIAAGLVLVTAAICLGYGVVMLRLAERLRPGLSAGVTAGDVGILGYIAVSLLATLLNVAVPLSPVVAGTACVFGLILLAMGARRFFAQGAGFGWAALPTVATLGALCVLLGLLIPRSTAAHYDSGLYHVQAIRLAMEYPLILGSANIHMRFGYNSSLFQTAALLSGGGLFGMAGAITSNALLMAFVLLASLQRAIATPANWRRSAVFALAVCAVAVVTPILSFRGTVGTPNSDIPSGIMVFYAFALALHLSDLQRDAAATDRRGGTAVLLFCVVALAVTLKLSAAPAVLLAVLPLLAWRRAAIAGRDLVLGIGAAAAIGVPWLLRGVATSGCIAYPQPSSCLPVPWRIHASVAQSDLDWMRSWARRPEVPPEIVLADWSWFPDWVAALTREPGLPTIVALAAAAALLALARLLPPGIATASAGASRAPCADIWVLAGVAVAGMAFWFVSAPLVRYGQSWIALLPMLAIAQCWPVSFRGRALPWPDGRRAAAALAAVLALVAIVQTARQPRARLADTALPHYPATAVALRGEHAGIPITIPVQGNQCWDAPRLCTPHLKAGLVHEPFLWTWWVRDPS
ncbi:hypothetical protein GXW78_23440 [Roseomonas terrae]|jgi:hypothetical protein|uniref:DUF8201 domain-containing protein n=1 Tax=Neoroseomonas terrae TaxID=424799 RepID=A0ABS5ENN1_9PROT|nr:hypothetical protein [Neoroseomonas terrae]MBR0652631.1 hypothetical protein [Neoroseomonas terrae]